MITRTGVRTDGRSYEAYVRTELPYCNRVFDIAIVEKINKKKRLAGTGKYTLLTALFSPYKVQTRA